MPHLNHGRGETRKSVNREVKCSCSMCGNPRRSAWHPDRTFPEMMAELYEREALADLGGYSLDRTWPKARKVEKPWVVEKQDLSSKGEPRGGWWLYRRYRTEQAALSALRQLQLNVRHYGRTGLPFSEYRLRDQNAA